MGGKRPLLLALVISLTGHITFVILYPSDTPERRVARFDLELLPPVPLVERTPLPETTPADEAKPLDPPPLPEDPQERLESTPVEAVTADAQASPAELPEQPALLNLSRPADWDEIVEGMPGPPNQLAFNPALALALTERQADRRRAQFVSSRQAAIYGVSDEAYRRSGPLGEEVKIDGGCVRLVEDKGVEEGQRWWAGQCTETRKNRFTLPSVEYDALGRAVLD